MGGSTSVGERQEMDRHSMQIRPTTQHYTTPTHDPKRGGGPFLLLLSPFFAMRDERPNWGWPNEHRRRGGGGGGAWAYIMLQGGAFTGTRLQGRVRGSIRPSVACPSSPALFETNVGSRDEFNGGEEEGRGVVELLLFSVRRRSWRRRRRRKLNLHCHQEMRMSKFGGPPPPPPLLPLFRGTTRHMFVSQIESLLPPSLRPQTCVFAFSARRGGEGRCGVRSW